MKTRKTEHFFNSHIIMKRNREKDKHKKYVKNEQRTKKLG